jgi:hypothetical protein
MTGTETFASFFIVPDKSRPGLAEDEMTDEKIISDDQIR